MLLFLMKSNPFSNIQTCHSLYWRKLSVCVLKVFIIKLVCRAILTINSISRCDTCQPFPELPWLSTPSPCSLPLVSTAIQPFLLSQQNQLQLLSFLAVLQLVAAAPFPQRPKEEPECINQGSADQRNQKYVLPGNLCFRGIEEGKMPVLCLLWGDTHLLLKTGERCSQA